MQTVKQNNIYTRRLPSSLHMTMARGGLINRITDQTLTV